MSTRETTNTGKIGKLQRFVGALQANRVELAHLEVSSLKLEGLLGDAEEALNNQGALAAEKQQASRELQASLSDAERLSSVLRLAVREHYGTSSEKLTEFGLQPFRGRTRRVKPPQPPSEVAKDPADPDTNLPS